ncbi:uncharacterized protein LOC129741709 [Uranotaenia lowii]|uniref:uncharacterized protein LOC129741709 n=1 Tax=Uranotaenia lowii TaxID=190385 RepID=UPI00247A1531|nr:uncharacterized protein LOC129741709 [Uranotaenia lowii]
MPKLPKEIDSEGNQSNYGFNKQKRQADTESSISPLRTMAIPATNTATDAPPNANNLPSIASTGVLLKSLNSSVVKPIFDYVFVLNIRKSETYSPLCQGNVHHRAEQRQCAAVSKAVLHDTTAQSETLLSAFKTQITLPYPT